MIFLVHQCDVKGCEENLVNDGNFDNNMEWVMAKESGTILNMIPFLGRSEWAA